MHCLWCGVGTILVSCLPMVVVFLHLGFSEEHRLPKFCTTKIGLISILLASIVFPLVPSFFHIWLLLIPRQTTRNREKYKKLERLSHDIKSICGSVESPFKLSILSYLMIRGILSLPWNEHFTSKCVSDSLWRVACFPSIPMASMICSVLSIMKAVFDLNIYPLVREYEISSRTFKISFDLILCFMPNANAIFRICAFSLMFVFLDFWSIIPCLVLFLLNLMIFGLSFGRYSYAATTYGSDGC